MVSVGETAPDFIAPAVTGGAAAELELFRLIEDSEAVVLAFYPVDFVPTCTAELSALERADWTSREDLAVVGVGADSLYAHAAYADRFGLSMPLVSDWTGSVADSYELLVDEWDAHTNVPARATVVVDGDWTVRSRERADPLARASPAPVESAAETLRDLGLDVDRPAVDYDAVE